MEQRGHDIYEKLPDQAKHRIVLQESVKEKINISLHTES